MLAGGYWPALLGWLGDSGGSSMAGRSHRLPLASLSMSSYLGPEKRQECGEQPSFPWASFSSLYSC